MKYKYSIQRQFTIIFGCLMAGTILLCWFINNTFLERYYINNKKHAMLEAYRVINASSNNGTLASDKFDIQFQNICTKNNINIVILDAEAKTLKTSANNYELLSKQLLSYLFNQDTTDGRRTILDHKKYQMIALKDDRTQQDFIDLWGVLDNGNLFLLRTPVESIRESVSLANRFLAYIGIGAAILAALIIMIVSRKISEPIKELTQISERMNHLDFDAKYKGKSRTEIALLGQNINQLSETLETTISELKSANNELLRDIEKKNEMEKMRTEFLSNVSHELKTPIALIQGYAEGLKECINDDAESRDFYCDVIMDESDKMNQMVKKLLTLNQLEFGNDTVEMTRFDITELITGVIQSASIMAAQKKVDIQFYKDGPVYVWGDEFKVEEVITNYLTNAMNHADGQRRIEIRFSYHDGLVRTSVFNTGEPIPEEDLEKIWVKFYKVDKARTREYGGSGIGLSIVKAIMDSFHQKCGVINHENGVEFWMELESNN